MRKPPKQRLIERCETLSAVLKSLKVVYGAAGGHQRDFIETIIGAAIWYMPQADGMWSGLASAAAVEAAECGNTVVRDHHYPRKIAARELFELSDELLTCEELLVRYQHRYGVFSVVTSEENRRLMKFQKAGVFTSPEASYEAAGIKLVKPAKLPK